MLIARNPPEKRWGGQERLDDEDDARERLLNAAEACFERFGLRRTTIDDVAREAKVSRSTVYRYFDSRGDLIAGAYLRESEAVNDKVRALMSRPGPFSDRIIEAALRSIDSVRKGRYLPLMLTPEGSILASKAVTASTAFYETMRETMGPFLNEAKASGEIRTDVELDDLNEWMLRLIFSFAMLDSPIPGGRTRIRRLLEAFLVPALAP